MLILSWVGHVVLFGGCVCLVEKMSTLDLIVYVSGRAFRKQSLKFGMV